MAWTANKWKHLAIAELNPGVTSTIYKMLVVTLSTSLQLCLLNLRLTQKFSTKVHLAWLCYIRYPSQSVTFIYILLFYYENAPSSSFELPCDSMWHYILYIYIHRTNAHQHVYSTCLLYASIFNPADQVMENADGFISNWAHRNPRLLLCLLRAIEMPQAICELRKYHTRCSRPCIFLSLQNESASGGKEVLYYISLWCVL